MNHKVCYISANCNQHPTIADWGNNNLICYGSCNSILIYDYMNNLGGTITNTLIAHNDIIKCVRWIRGIDYEEEIVSSSADCTAIVWTKKDKIYSPFILKGHKLVVNIVDGLYKGPNLNNCIVASISLDAVNIWRRVHPSDDFNLFQKVDFGVSSVISAVLYRPSFSNQIIFACGIDNSNIHICIENNDEFHLDVILKGHEDWVRGLSFTLDESDLLLATSSQDMYIRLWRFSQLQENEVNDYLTKITINNQIYKICVDSVLTGHEGWVYSVNWGQNLNLLSASLDKSVIIWELSKQTNLWCEKARMGEIGGNTLGFYGGVFSPNGKKVLAHSYHGAFHLWENLNNNWIPCVTIGGHFDNVVDIAWEPDGQYLLSVSSDQTTRIHGKWSKSDTWHEIARPQIHGYDLSAIAILSRYKFASAAEEKIIRIFDAPLNFVENFKRICQIEDDFNEGIAKGATVPSLGLSNKAVFENSNENLQKNVYPDESHFVETILSEPPTEETLLQNTLWPESQKLYGHGYEVFCLATSSDGKFLASACKATNTEHASIFIWDTITWKLLQKLQSHSLTVVQLAFSFDSKKLLSVSRDRRWSLFRLNSNNNNFDLITTTNKSTSIHTRIIWCCAWSFDSKYFVTGSRDGKVVVWTINDDYDDKFKQISMKNFKGDSITALNFASILLKDDNYLLAIGFESGFIRLYKWKEEIWDEILVLDKSLAHHLTVKRLLFRPQKVVNEKDVNLQLASCGYDWAVKIHNISNLF